VALFHFLPTKCKFKIVMQPPAICEALKDASTPSLSATQHGIARQTAHEVQYCKGDGAQLGGRAGLEGRGRPHSQLPKRYSQCQPHEWHADGFNHIRKGPPQRVLSVPLSTD